jgi:hypothetical protein
MPMADLSSILWRERELLDQLLFRLEVEHLVLSTGRSGWLTIAAREIEMVLAEMRYVELLRAVSVDTLASEENLCPNPSLREIADCSPEPWRAIWLDHREAFTALTAQISELSRSNRRMLPGGRPAGPARPVLQDRGALT